MVSLINCREFYASKFTHLVSSEFMGGSLSFNLGLFAGGCWAESSSRGRFVPALIFPSYRELLLTEYKDSTTITVVCIPQSSFSNWKRLRLPFSLSSSSFY